MTKIIFDDLGQGPPLIFLHGFCARKEIWNSFTQNLVSQFRVINVDLPSFGESEKINSPFTINQVGDTIVKCLIKNKIDSGIFIGHSLGGYVTLSILERHPQMVKGFCLFHSSAFPDELEKRLNRIKSIEFLRKNEVDLYIDSFIPNLFFNQSHPSLKQVQDLASGISSNTLIDYIQAMKDRPDYSHHLKSPCPKLIIAGRHDPFVSIAVSRKMKDIATNYRYLELEKGAHIGFLENILESKHSIISFANSVYNNK